MNEASDIELGRAAYRSQNWNEAYQRLTAADREADLDAGLTEFLANAAYLTAREGAAAQLWARAHYGLVDVGEVGRAARVGFVLSLTSLLKGDASVSGGWLARTRRLLETVPGRRVENGFCAVVTGLRELNSGDREAALQTFDGAVELATEFQDPDLLALSLLSRGQALIEIGRSGEGLACLDEAMVSVTSGRVAPIFSGIIYCAVILTCQSIFDIERAREWTNAFNSWCAPQPDLVPFRGQCLVHRSEILQMRGDWPAALKEAENACRWLAGKSEATVGRAHYQKGELHRLLGEFDKAENSFREANRHGVDPQPGHALLRLGDGQTEAAVASIQSACGTQYGAGNFTGDSKRFRLLGPSVEIFLAAGKTDTATAAAEELAECARAFETPLLAAKSAEATGSVLAVSDRLEEALGKLKKSLAIWRRLGMPYEMARTRVRLADVCHRCGDAESVAMHGEAARAVFRELGATTDLSVMERVPWRTSADSAAGLTRRQKDVLRQLASGQSNREIASELGISEHTVARHISNIFDKTGVSSRAAAVDFAHRNKLLE